MANTKGVANFKNAACSGKQSLLPPKSPFPSISPTYADYGSSPCLGSKNIPKPREGNKHHQRTSSESFLIEEQPSWLDDLLNEPETPVRRGTHRRSTSDSFAYLNVSSIACDIDNVSQEELKHRSLASRPSWASQELDHRKEIQYSLYYTKQNSIGRMQNRGWDPSLNIMNYPSNLASTRDKVVHQSPGPTDAIRDADAATSTGYEKDQEECTPQDSERREVSHANLPQSDVDPKRVKQKFAQRSRVRKLQYIAELERNVQALQAEISEVSAEMEFLDQHNLILNLENKALKQRLDSVAQEQLIKCFQQEMLEREISRLCALHRQQQQQQQQPYQPTPSHGSISSRDLDSQFASLSLKHTRQIPDGTQ